MFAELHRHSNQRS